MQRWPRKRCCRASTLGLRTFVLVRRRAPSEFIASSSHASSGAAPPWTVEHQRSCIIIPPVERLTTPPSPRLSSRYVDSQILNDGRTQQADAQELDHFRFAIKNSERGLLDHGVTPDAISSIAEAEEEYRASSSYLHNRPGGAGMPESETHVDDVTGQQVTTTRIAAPFGETYVPSNRERFVEQQRVGELSRQRNLVDKPFMLDEHAQLNLRKERQLCELLASPMPQLAKAEEVAHFLLTGVYAQNLALQPRTCESVMLLYSHASFFRRLAARSSGADTPAVPRTPQDVPFLDDMRRLYTHQKRCFISPTPLSLEHLMTTLSVITAPSTTAFHLANRLLLDADKFVLLPTRTTYTAYFTLCHVNNAMQFAMARYTDAVQALQLPVDAPMLTALLKGLNESGYVEEAVSLLSRMRHVAVSTPLLNASLETLLLSEQALSCFSLYDAMRESSVKPNAETYTLLLLACEKSQQWRRVTAILAEMQRRRVRGNEQTLNLLLKGLLHERLHSFAAQLYYMMLEKKVPLWPALELGVRPLLQ
ncbi:conserved hypothetical protein [Leishmania mexicana MHOM/GT/2001/U1103]|uniref:Kinetoplast ribosomal PPR-repeat containing protein 3 n=1 Tax=Leishmania mexicana (strain MHOM/GT/2001/U1103) TaxID=929439 RepID=E9AUJ2_LEIMU|nr:conserved hypothetical protein [Leishmania mexicana MHOM/GT/2001/U1103]CBZ26621.1 conserved hypothetical protein [Leishmania mexicana MHOM/GT/2001/U1103]